MTFSININRAAAFLLDIKRMEPNLDRSNPNTSFNAKKIFLEHHIKCEAVIIFLVTALEVYIESVFRIASKKINLRMLKHRSLKRFIKMFKLKKKPSAILLEDILDDRMDFQRKENSKIAYKLIGINLPKIDNALWQNIFDVNRNGSIMGLRHRIIHTGLNVLISYEFTFQEVKNKVTELIKFISQVENKRKSINLHDETIIRIFD